MNRVCKKCGIEKPIELFVKNKGCNLGYTHTCRECNDKKFGNEYRHVLHSKPKIEVESKVCVKCGQTKGVSEFYHNKQRKDGYSNACKKCDADYMKDYKKTEEGSVIVKRAQEKSYVKNKDKRAEYRQSPHYIEYRNSPPYKEKARVQHDVYYEKNKEHINKLTVIAHNKKRKEDDGYRMCCNLRSRLIVFLKEEGKQLKMAEYLGCSRAFVIKYIESLWQEGMSWENYGFYGWHVDHIIPCKNFDHKDVKEQKKCWHYTNLRPLWAKDNLKKGAKLLVA